jgi:hypothetical protein
LPAGPGSSKSGGKTGKTPGPRSPAPKPGSDSDVRLVQEGGEMDFELPLDEGKKPETPSPKTPRRKGSKLSGPDSSVRIVPLEPSDSDIKMVPDADDSVSMGKTRGKTASDSDIRLEDSKPRKRDSDDPLVTEEIDLDAELGKPAGGPSSSARRKSKGAGKPAGKPAQPQLPTTSPFELSEADLDVDEPSRPAAKQTQHKPASDSSDNFELAPTADSSSPLELGSDEMPSLELDDEVQLGEVTAGAGDSGINLRDPADSGISLEQEGSDEMEFELSLDAGSTPKPGPAASLDDSDSEFELSLDDSGEPATLDSDSSEFELSLDESSGEVELEPKAGADDDSSEFELTLDDSGGSSPLDESGERDIFETDFEVPALEEESGSEAVALDDDTDLESSDFDLALGDEDMVAEDESGSQVVALEDEEEADEGAATVQRKARTGAKAGRPKAAPSELALSESEEESPYANLDTEEAAGKVKIEYRETPATPWGPVPALLLIPSVLVLFVVGLMGFELVQSMLAYQKGNKASGLIIEPLTEAVMGPLPGSTKKK